MNIRWDIQESPWKRFGDDLIREVTYRFLMIERGARWYMPSYGRFRFDGCTTRAVRIGPYLIRLGSWFERDNIDLTELGICLKTSEKSTYHG